MTTATKKYNVVNGTSYHVGTPKEVIDVLERCRKNRTRIRVHYGTTDDSSDGPIGRDWLDEFDVSGTLSRSWGPTKIPILLHNSRSMGGGGILDHCIVRIRTTGKNGRDLYRHPGYSQDKVELKECNVDGLHCEAYVNGELHARFSSETKGKAWIRKMGFDQ